MPLCYPKRAYIAAELCAVNASELSALPDRAHSFAAEIGAEFPEALHPCDRVLEIKVGAQVMLKANRASSRRSSTDLSAKLHTLLSGCSWEHALVLRADIRRHHSDAMARVRRPRKAVEALAYPLLPLGARPNAARA